MKKSEHLTPKFIFDSTNLPRQKQGPLGREEGTLRRGKVSPCFWMGVIVFLVVAGQVDVETTSGEI